MTLTTDRAEPMQGLAEYLHNLATSMEDEDAETLRRWADEVEASRQRPAAHIHGNDAFSIESVAKAVDASMHNERPAAQAASAEPVARLQQEGTFADGKPRFEIVILDRPRCHDDMYLYAERPAEPAQAPWKAISDAIRKVTGHPDLTSGSLSLLGEIIRALAQASPASDAWRCACGAALYIDAEGKPRSKAADGVRPVEATSLPELPEALVIVRDEDLGDDTGGWIVDCDCEGPLTYSLKAGQMLYTEEQMHEYARQAIAGVREDGNG